MPVTVHPFDIATFAATPWKNGGGTTREIVCQPPGAGMGDFDWRVSIATIAAAGPFSTFPGVDRVITLLAGDGVRLRGVGVDHRLDAPLVPFAFSGEVEISCDLLGGESTDFNVMTRRSGWRAELQVLHAAGEVPAASAGVLLAVGGGWDCITAGHTSRTTTASDGRFRCAADGGLWWHGASTSWQVTPSESGASLVAVRFSPKNEGT